MKVNFKKSMAISALAFAGLAPVSPAFCVGAGSKLGSYHALIVGKYFENKKDLESLIMAGKKFEELGATYKFNPRHMTRCFTRIFKLTWLTLKKK